VKPLDPLTVPLTGTNLIEASAGTGKTYAITDLYVRLLLELRLGVSQILVVTYTNAATAELRDRVRVRVRAALAAFDAQGNTGDTFLDQLVKARSAQGSADQDRVQLAVALHSFDEAAIFTIHGFCQRILQENAFESGVAFDTELIANQGSLLTEVVQDFWVRQLHDAPASFVGDLGEQKVSPGSLEQLALKAIGNPDMPVLPVPGDAPVPRGKRKGAAKAPVDDVDVRVLTFQREFIDYVRRELRTRKERARTQSFDDLLQRLVEALRGPGGDTLAEVIRRRFRAALIDEFQDTDPIQYEIFRRVYLDTDAVLFLIGDPKQAIYAFRGADVFAYIQAKHDVAGPPKTLNVNHRADPSLVRAVDKLFGRLKEPFVFDDIPFAHVEPAPDRADRLGGTAAGQPPLQILFVDRTKVETGQGGVINKPWGEWPLARALTADIVRFLGSGATIGDRPVEPGDIAVLCRKNKQAAILQEVLRQMGVPSVLQSEASVFEAPEAEEVQRLVVAMADPSDSRAIRAALCTPMLGQNAEALCALEHDEQRWDDWVRHFQAWHDTWTQRGFVAAFRTLLDSQGVPKLLLGLLDGERRLTNVLHLMELLHAASTEERRGPQALVNWLTQMRTDTEVRSVLAGEAAQIRLESDRAAVKLTTLHKSKGLQYPIVYCPYLWDGTLLRKGETALQFHDPDDGNRLKLDIRGGDHPVHRERAETELFAENLRLLYVALTRAQHRCSVVWGAFRDAQSSPLGYLLHQSHGADGNLRKVTADRLKAFFASGNDQAIRDELEALAASAPACIGVENLSIEPGPRYAPTAAQSPTLSCLTATRELHRMWRVSSFSGLTASGGTISALAEEGLDHDATMESISANGAATQPSTETMVVLHDFPRGARAGTLIHKVMEDLDFGAVDPTAVGNVVRQTLARSGFEGTLSAQLSRAIADVVATPLAHGAPALRLRDIPLSRRLSELEFILPVAGESIRARVTGATPRSMEGAALLTAARLADVFAACAAPPVPPGYAQQVRELGFGALTGFLRGYMDLVFEHESRWYVVDYKSNMLGKQPHDYQPAKLIAAMGSDHYFLQYHLYVVALHRYLAVRVPDYDYEHHFGGVYYLFLRGMAPDYAHRNGIFHDRPSRTLIDRLSAVLAGQPGVA